MQTFKILIETTISREIEVTAENKEKARSKVLNQYGTEIEPLDFADNVTTDFINND